ncbi:MAG: glyoxalase [Ectothiorhodospiraceae bacterium]|nr:glyoxalase [Ectothiorhodospiraceae bacterium]
MGNLVFHHMAIACKDQDTIERWYCKYFGFERARLIDLGEEKIVFIKNGDAYLELFAAKEDRPYPSPVADGVWFPDWRHIAFKVDDIDAKIAEMGDDANITQGPMDFSGFIPGWKTVWVADPEGNIVEISQGYVDQDNPPPLD